MKNLIVREAETADLPGYVDICMKIWGGGDARKITDHFQKSFSVFNPGYSVALLDGNVVGTGEGLPIREKLSITEMNEVEAAVDLYDTNGDFFYIHGVEVLQEHRNLGIGRALFEYNLNLAKKLNCRQVCGLGIYENIDFWISLGFETEGAWQQYKNVGRFIRIHRAV